jgi:putative membrane protein
VFGALSRQRSGLWSYRRRLLLAVTPLLALSGQAVALAHMDTPVTPDNVWTSWNLDPLIVVPLFLLVVLYLSGLRKIWHTAGRNQGVPQRRAVAFLAGVLTLLIALVSPLDRVSGALFSMHMVQHLLLVVVAAPLLVYSAPLAPVLVALPRPWRNRAGTVSGTPAIRTAADAILNPLVVWWLQAVSLWLWHIPALYEAALRSSWWHALEHAMFLSTACLFWWVVIQPHGRRRLGLGLTVIFLFTAMIQSSALGALITFAPSTWYAAHADYTAAWSISPIGDQQLAGLIMWVPGGLIYLCAALAVFFIWFRLMDRNQAISSSEERVLDSFSGTDRSHSPRSG